MKDDHGAEAPGPSGDQVFCIDLRDFKAQAARLLPANHPVRRVLAREQDIVPRSEGLAKLELYVRFVLALGPDASRPRLE